MTNDRSNEDRPADGQAPWSPLYVTLGWYPGGADGTVTAWHANGPLVA